LLCPACRRTVPDESTFCLGCGTRLAPAGRLAPPNGAGSPAAAPAPAGVAARTSPGPAAAGGRQAYLLAFGAVRDERLRYHLARWVLAQAPAHGLGEVQAGLERGEFVTYLALAPDEVDAVRTGLERLGIPGPLVTLVPAAGTETLRLPLSGGRRPAGGEEGNPRTWLFALLVLLGLFVAGYVMTRLLGTRGF
jgi:hypothetical protein